MTLSAWPLHPRECDRSRIHCRCVYESGATDPIFGRDRKHQLARARCSSCAVSAAIAPAQLPLNLPTDPFSARPDPPTHGACTWRCKATNHFRRPCLSDVRAAPRALSAHPRFRCPLRPTRLAGGRTPPTEPNAAHGAPPPPPPPPPARAAAKATKKRRRSALTAPRKTRRTRAARACLGCRLHRRKCDGKRPCGRCAANWPGCPELCVYGVYPHEVKGQVRQGRESASDFQGRRHHRHSELPHPGSDALRPSAAGSRPRRPL